MRALLRHSGRAAFDLRVGVRPGHQPAVEVALLARTWAPTADVAAGLALRMREEVQQLLPDELLTTAVTDAGHVARLLDPYGDEPVQAATVTKREVLVPPTRPDSAAPFHFAVSPFGGRPEDWAPLHSALARSPLPMTVSLALFPVRVPADWARELTAWSDYYGRLGEEGQLPGGLYYGPRRLEPDLFAAAAARGLRLALASWSAGTAMARLQVTAPQLPADVAELLGSALASTRLQDRPEPGYEIRWLRGGAGSRTARWNLAALDCYPARGRPEIWERPDRLPPRYALLSVLVDAEEASAVLGLPTARAGGAALLPVRGTRSGGRGARRADVVVLTTTPVEAAAVDQALAGVGARRHEVAYGATNTYTLHHPVADTVVAHVRCTMGSSAAGGSILTVAAALEDLEPWAVLAVGIAFGADVAKQPLNDLLLSEWLTAYELQRWGTDESGGPSTQERGPTVPASPTLLGRFRDSHLEDVGIRVQAGQLLSGEKLVDNADQKADLLRRFPDAIGGEMEGAGLFAASHRAAVEWLVVKAVCDHGQDKATNKGLRQREAAEVAARAFATVLRQGGLRPHR
jgi:nucleoside phosphorylase